MNAFIFHGVNGHKNENWFPWIKGELEKLDIETEVMDFTSKDISLSGWEHSFTPFLDKIDNQTIFISHSLGCFFSMYLLDQLEININSLFLVAPFIDEIKEQSFNHKISSFIKQNIDFSKIKNQYKYCQIYMSLNDPIVSIKSSIKVAKSLEIESFHTFINAGHFNSKAGYDTFERLLNDIKFTLLSS